MSKGKINKSTIDKLEPRTKPYVMWDTQIPGFGCRVTPKGIKSYVMKYYLNGKQRWMVFGHTDICTPDEARKRAKKHKADIEDGDHPTKVSSKVDPTVSDLVDRVIARHIPSLRPNTVTAYLHDMGVIKAHLGERTVKSITKHDLDDIVYGLQDKPAAANRIVQVARTVFELAIEWGLRKDGVNPARKAKTYPKVQRQRYLSEDEIERLEKAIRARTTKGKAMSPYVGWAIHLMLLTGLRIGEARELKWRQVDLVRKCLTFTIHEHKTGRKNGIKTIPLNDAAVELLRGVPLVDGNPYVFPGSKSKTGHMGRWLSDAWRKIRDDAGLNDGDHDEPIVAHSLRHTFGSYVMGEGAEDRMTGKLMGHVNPSSTARYTHMRLERARAASNAGVAPILRSLGGATALPGVNPALVVADGVEDKAPDLYEDRSI